MQHSLGLSNYVAVLPLIHPILLRVMGCCKLSPNALLGTHVHENIGEIFPAIIIPQCFDLLPNLVFYQGLKLRELGEDLPLLLHKEDTCFSRIVIYEDDIVPMSHEGWRREGPTYI